jgi:hypothetical protein
MQHELFGHCPEKEKVYFAAIVALLAKPLVDVFGMAFTDEIFAFCALFALALQSKFQRNDV